MQAHPSRSAPKCVNCQHLQDSEFCNHPAMSVNPVTGRAAERARHVRLVTRDKAERFGIALCGPEGLLFQPMDSAA